MLFSWGDAAGVLSNRRRSVGRFLSAKVTVSLVFGGMLISAALGQSAQSLQNLANGNLTSSQLMQLQQMRQGNGGATTGNQEITPQQMVLVPVDPQKPKEFSTLEKIMSERAGISLEQYGYDQFGVGRPVTISQVGGVQENYILGSGDEIIISLRGQENGEYRVSVDRDGRIVLPRIAPVSAGGRSFGDFKRDLLAAIHRAYVSTEGYISLGQVRQVSVTVSGEVTNPGVRTLNGLSTVADAIALSGGVLKSGSLRAIQIRRGGRTLTVDLYGVLSEHAPLRDFGLADGDRIIVPTVGASIAIAGDVRHPGVFELPSHHGAISVREALALANRTVVPGVYRLSLLRQMADGRRHLVDVSGQKGGEIRDGEILIVKMAVNAALSQIEVKGATRSGGYFSLDRYKTLHDLFPNEEAFAQDAYMLFGYIDRLDPLTHMHSAVPFSPKRVADNSQRISLKANDVVHVVTKKEMRLLIQWAMREQNEKSKAAKNIRGYKVGADEKSAEQSGDDASAVPGTGLRRNKNNPSRDMQSDRPNEADQTDNYSNNNDPSAINQNPAVIGGGYPQDSRMTMQGGQAMQDSRMPYAAQAQQPLLNGYGTDMTSQMGSQSFGQYPYSQQPYGQLPYAQMPYAQGKADVLTEINNKKNAQTKLEDLVPPDADYLKDILSYYVVNIVGAVNSPGVYLMAPDTSLSDALSAAGGLKPDADLSNVEVTSSIIDVHTGASTTVRQSHSLAQSGSADAIKLLPRDGVLVRAVYTNRTTGTVTISGQVRYPGTYSLLRGDRLSSILKRAGGLTDVAYPDGAVFLRESLGELEHKANQRAAKQIEDQLLTAMNRRSKDSQMSAEAFTAMQDYVHELEMAPVLGRMVVLADPATLTSHPEEDPLLEANDRIVIPSKPFSVSVMGEVLQPNSVPYKQGMTPHDYIDMAGGFTQSAEEDEVFVVLPNGKAYRDQTSWFSFGNRDIPPGSMIYVGRDISGYDLRQGFIDIASIVSSFATTAASMAVLIKEANQ